MNTPDANVIPPEATVIPPEATELSVQYPDVLKMVGVEPDVHARRMHGLRTEMNSEFNLAVVEMEARAAEMLSRAHQSHEKPAEGECSDCVTLARVVYPKLLEQLRTELGLPEIE